MEDVLYTSEETARRFVISNATLATWRSIGKGPRYLKIGRAVYYRESAIREWLKAQEHDPAAKADAA